MRITEQQLFDYIECPAIYHIKYNMKIDIPEEIHLSKLLNSVSNFFYLNLLNGKIPTYNQIKKKWDALCEQYKLDNKKVITGWGYVLKLIEWCENNKICVADVSSNYMISLGEDQLIGNIETILVTPQKQIELFYTNFSEKALDPILIDMKLKYGLDALGFYTLYNKMPDIQKILSVKYNEVLLTNRTQPDITRVRDTIQNVINCIKNNLFYPRESAFCKTCPAKQYCKYWHN